MPKQKVDLRKVFQASDSIAFLVIAIGLFIALFLDEMSVRLIGICITILGGVALFMIVSPRLTDLQIISPVRPSQTPDLGSRTIQDGSKRSQTFDPEAYRESFGSTESGESPFVDEDQIDLFEGQSELIRKPAPTQKPSPAAPKIDTFIDHQDAESGIRIVGTRPGSKKATPKLVSELRQETRKNLEAATPEETSEEVFSSPVAVITGRVTDEIQLSEDVKVRPISRTPRVTEAPPPPPVTAPAPPPVEEVEEVEEHEEDVVLLDEATVEVPEEVEQVPVQRETSRRSPAVALTTFVNDEADEDLSSQEPRREFDYLLNRVLMVIRSATNARTAAFLWVNAERQQLVVEAKITEAEAEFTTERKIPMGRDALSQIAREGVPEIITQISPAAEMDLLPYYVRSAQTMSFIGVPVYYGGNVVGILCADSLIEDAYSDITVGFFGQFTKLISGLVSSYTAKFDLMQASAILEATKHFREHVGTAPSTVQQVVRGLFATLIQHMDISRIGVVSFDPAQKLWTLTDARSAMDDGYRDNVGCSVDLTTSAVGHAISSATTVVHAEDFKGTRVFVQEPPLETGQFVAVPLCTASDSYGSLFLENVESSLSQQDIGLAEALGQLAGELLEHIRKAEELQGSALLDHATGVLNTQGFEMRIREEFKRSVDYNLPLTLCMVHLDPSRTNAEQRERALLHILRIVKNQLRDYDIVARVESDQLALGLVGYRLQEAQNWTETMRREIASTPVDIDGKRLSFTVSIGIAQSEPRDEWDDLIAHATAALDVSKRVGNKVTVFA
ncbi:MAG: GAF domain-containing protein [Candidatus Kapabacteria bacterium]|nr:GAF domain-containing protein [Ignavibacteria bacterium]MBP6509182.1 GAF domain-containing protein [Candidatus Kapabacteria bacterium]MBK6419612.1 GAF domain-containing protein [Ignavibacteria bacterium]MBK6759765.1 GAF domain-containing protein [Ignavibacteria bacterium]MBK7413449.1 GAF domain-containing protein [Ignavibacteria bacterium]